LAEITLHIIDSHAHLEFAQFDADRETMLDRARAAGVETILAIGRGWTRPFLLPSGTTGFTRRLAFIRTTRARRPRNISRGSTNLRGIHE